MSSQERRLQQAVESEAAVKERFTEGLFSRVVDL
jgi:hypothetical protein